MNVGGRGVCLAIVRVALAGVALLVPATATAATTPSHAGSLRAAAAEARQFWTPARMKRATPIEVVRPGPSSPAAFRGSGAGQGRPRLIPSTSPRSQASASSHFDPVAEPALPGLREHGVIFLEAEGHLGRCSGTSVSAPNFSVVITAGHCINGGGPRGRWYRGRWLFVPGYRYGQRPFGVFPAKWLDTTSQWLSNGSENVDVGAAVVMRNERGQRLADAVGGTGIAWNLPADQVFDVHGYPAAPPFDGETQRLCAGTPFLGHDPDSFLADGPLNLAVDCDVTGGASGGGWTIRDDVLNGVTNYGYPDDPATDFGAYFGREVARLYARAARVR
jgi:V8-like Glu-specific endopeptidase